jgi:hypothetical protein
MVPTIIRSYRHIIYSSQRPDLIMIQVYAGRLKYNIVVVASVGKRYRRVRSTGRYEAIRNKWRVRILNILNL